MCCGGEKGESCSYHGCTFFLRMPMGVKVGEQNTKVKRRHAIEKLPANDVRSRADANQIVDISKEFLRYLP